MSTLSLLPVSMLESLGLGIVQKAADAALGAGVLKISDDGNGITAGLTLPSGQSVNIDNLVVNSQGLSGRLFIDGLDTNPLSATLFDGFTIALTAFDITLAQSGLAASHIGGHLTLPFFTDSSGNPETVDVEIGTKADSSIQISLSAVESTQSTTSDGLVQLIYDLPGGLGTVEIDVASLEIDKSSSGTWTIILSGNLIIETPDLNWPSIELKGLGIDSKGHISLEGGWINLPNQMALDFFGFHVGLQKLGFGTDASGDKWIGFNGDINLVEGLSLGGSVQGLVINLTTGAVSLAGVGISFEIPDVLTIGGEIDHIQVTANNPTDLENAGLPGSIFNAISPLGPTGPKSVNLFAGQVKVVIEAAGDLEVDAAFIVGNFGGQTVFFLDLDAELPVGIPIFLDIALYGMQGLVATGLEPNPEPNNTWWEWFKYPASNTSGDPNNVGGPNLSATPDYSATDVNKWLVPKAGAFAIGAGAAIGTEADDGYTASAAIMFVLMLPGPVISLIGKANILSKRVGGASDDANFDAMATYDGNSQTFDLTIDAQYSIPVVLDISATAELYVGGGEWFFALGKPPHDKRVKARIFDLFESDAYFVVSNAGLITGTWTGYKNSWSLGPLSASVDAYLATLAAIQWSPLQIAGGIQLYGNLQLSAFGIGVGLTADALLEGCAPNPFWVHGELSVELDLPWPLPNVGGTISLSWGGDDGSVPPGPLGLSHIDATLIDHADSADKQASDHYMLLAHRAKSIAPDLPVTYDPVTPGVLSLTGASLTAWQGRTAGMLPDLVPDNTSTAQMAPVVPQDAHFTLNFAHPTVDGIGTFANALNWSNPAFPKDADVESPTAPPPPNQVGKDDMSDINPNPPSVPFLIRHTLTEVDLYQCAPGPFTGGVNPWTLVYSATAATSPENPSPSIGVTQLNGTWLTGDPSKADPRQVMTQLKIFPWRLLPGTDWTAQWDATSQIAASGNSFTDQNLQFTIAKGIEPPAIGNIEFSGVATGLLFTIDGSQANPVVTIRFPQPSVLSSITALVYQADGEFEFFNRPQCSGDGVTLTPQSSWQDTNTQAWTLTFATTAPAIQKLTIPINGNALLLYAIDYSTPPVPMAILPTAPALFALKTVTRIEAQRVGSGNFQTVANGDPIVEFTYFQTAAGPGTAIGSAPPVTPALPSGPAPYLQLAANCGTAQQPASAFPLAGALTDLHTYTQWSWPLNGAIAAYYGYDVNVEFVESYVNALYTAFSNGNVDLSLHFRCVDRNNDHTLLVPNAIHVPSIPQESALAAGALTPDLPPYLLTSTISTHGVGVEQQALLQKRAAQAVNVNVLAEAAPVFVQPSISTLTKNLNLNTRTGLLGIQQIDPGLAGEILHEIEENNAARQVKNLWFKPLQPSTRYTLDVVAGPLERGRDQDLATVGGAKQGSLSAVISASDAIGLLSALQAYFAYEDSLTTLERVQFATSRYESFTAQMANVANQLGATPGTTPVRNYVAVTDPVTWLGSQIPLLTAYVKSGEQYLLDHDNLASLVAGFDPLADDLQPGITPAANGAAALVSQRQTIAADWTAFSNTVNAIYDGLIAALGHPEMASNTAPITVPDTEISLFTDSTGAWVNTILIQSPEPLPWQRIWRWIKLTNSVNSTAPLLALWNADGTIGLLVPIELVRGVYQLNITFQGNIGAEAPCITENGSGVSETVPAGPITMGPRFRRLRGILIPLPDRPILDLAPRVMAILEHFPK
jgi:hypothetical protein